MVQILTDLFSFSELWIWLLRYFVLIDYQERIFEKERKEIMASKEVSPHISFSFDFTIASWQLTWPHCHISLRFKSIAVEFWFVECFFVDSYDDHLSRECLSEVGELEKQFSQKYSRLQKIAFQILTTPPTRSHHKVKLQWKDFSISKSKPRSRADKPFGVNQLRLQQCFILQVHLTDRRPSLGQDEGFLSLARQDWHAPRPHQKADSESGDALCLLFWNTRLWMDPRNWSQALSRV